MQVIRANPNIKSFGQRLNEGIGSGLETLQQYQQMAQEQERMQQEQAKQQRFADEVKKMYGIDVEGMSREGMEKLATEAYKQEAKRKQFQEKQSYLDKLLSPNEKPQEVMNEKASSSNENQSSGFDVSSISDEDIARASAIDPNIGRSLQHSKDVALREKREREALERSEFKEERAYHTQFSKPAVERANTLRNALPKQEAALNYARQAIESGEVGAFTMNHLAEITGADSLRTAKGAQLILAAKEQLLPSLGRISAKAQNQYMEKRMASMIPQIGSKDEANLTMQEMLEAEAEMDKAYLTEFDRISEQDTKDYRFEKKDIEKRAREAVKHKEDEISKRTSYRLKEIEETEQGLSSLKSKVGKNVVRGTPLTLAMGKLYDKKFGKDALSVAKKNGYYIPTKEEFMIFEQRPQEYRENL